MMGTLQENPALGHITTFGGHPVCCAAGLAALNYLAGQQGGASRSKRRARCTRCCSQDHPAVREIRRSGLLLAVELGESAKLYRIMELFKEAGILSDWFLFCDTAFRISPPLTISEEEVRDKRVSSPSAWTSCLCIRSNCKNAEVSFTALVRSGRSPRALFYLPLRRNFSAGRSPRSSALSSGVSRISGMPSKRLSSAI